MENNKSLFSLSRLEAITDGIFAIIITILILTISVPDGDNVSSSKDLNNALLNTLPLIMNYIISFFLISTFWMSHILELKMLKNTNRHHILLNFVYIFFVSLIPFTTSLLGDYAGYIVAEIIFHLNIFLVYIASIVQWYYAIHISKLKSDSISNDMIKKEEAIQKFKLIVPLIALGLTFLISEYSSWAYLSLPFGISLIKKAHRKKT